MDTGTGGNYFPIEDRGRLSKQREKFSECWLSCQSSQQIVRHGTGEVKEISSLVLPLAVQSLFSPEKTLPSLLLAWWVAALPACQQHPFLASQNTNATTCMHAWLPALVVSFSYLPPHPSLKQARHHTIPCQWPLSVIPLGACHNYHSPPPQPTLPYGHT